MAKPIHGFAGVVHGWIRRLISPRYGRGAGGHPRLVVNETRSDHIFLHKGSVGCAHSAGAMVRNKSWGIMAYLRVDHYRYRRLGDLGRIRLRPAAIVIRYNQGDLSLLSGDTVCSNQRFQRRDVFSRVAV